MSLKQRGLSGVEVAVFDDHAGLRKSIDHADGNEWLHGEGATILAQENTRKHLAMAQRVEDWNFDFPPSPSGAQQRGLPKCQNQKRKSVNQRTPRNCCRRRRR